jgi:hypothetical protein
MRVLIQQAGTGLYFKGPRQWVADKSTANSFNTSTEAVEFCLRQGLEGVQILLSFPDPQYDIVMMPMPGGHLKAEKLPPQRRKTPHRASQPHPKPSPQPSGTDEQ